MRHRRAAADHLCSSAAGQAAGDELAHHGRVADSRAVRRHTAAAPDDLDLLMLGGDDDTRGDCGSSAA